MASGNANPIGIVDRFWEAIDLILKTLTHREGPFSWEGKHFTHRHVNIWPRPWQQPHPPLWAATGDPTTSAELGRRGIVNVMVFRSAEETMRAWASYRKARAEAGLPAPGPDRFGYAAFVYTGDTDEEGVRVGSKLLWFLNTGLKSAPQYSKLLPGAVPPEYAPALYRTKPRPGTVAAPRPAAGLIGITRRAGDGQGADVRGQPGQRVPPDQGVPGEGGAIRAPRARQPLRLHDPPGGHEGPEAVREGRPAAPGRALDQDVR